MRRRPYRLVTTTAALALSMTALGGCHAQVPSPTPGSAGPHATVVAPLGAMAPRPEQAPDEPTATFTALAEREQVAAAQAAAAGADITAAVLDRNTGQLVVTGAGRTIAIASVVKVFIADDLLLQVARGETDLSPQDRRSLDVMLRSSDDSAAEVFWNRGGGSAIVERVVARYGLGATRPPSDGRWFNTISTTTDLVRYYDKLLSGSGGLPAEQTEIILDDLGGWTPTAPDGMVPGGVYSQRFGIPEGLPRERVAVKQGWMCCVGADWMHLSTGIIGADRRYVMAIGSMQATDADTARHTITDVVRTLFPQGHI